MAPPAEHFDINNLRNLMQNPLAALERIGTIWHAMTDGVLFDHVKLLLEALPSEQRAAYFREGWRGSRLLSRICFMGKIKEVKYAYETLQLNRTIYRSCASAEHGVKCPLLSALTSHNPSVAVIRYILEKGHPVTPKAYYLWAACQTTMEHLGAILKVLVKHGRESIPPIRSLLPIMIDPRATLVMRRFVDKRSNHLDVLRPVVTFTTEDICEAARLGFGRMLEQMTIGDDSIDQDKLADLFEYCEFAAYCHNTRFPSELRYFKKALQIRQNQETRKIVSFGSRIQFTSIEDLERIEEQMKNNDYVECNWQMLLAAASAVAMKSDVTFEAMKGFVNLDQVAEVKSFVISSGHFLGDQLSFVNSLRKRCAYIVQATMQPELMMLPKLYDCLKEVFVDGYEPQSRSLVATIVMFLTRVSVCPDALNQLDLVRDRRDELLFLMLYSLQAPNPVRNEEMTIELVAPFITRLLRMGAGLGILPGHFKSTLRLILSSTIDLKPNFIDVLRNHTCCSLDLLPSERKSLDFPEKIKSPLSLKCIAAAQCSKLPRKVLEENLPSSLVSTAAGHPQIDYSK